MHKTQSHELFLLLYQKEEWNISFFLFFLAFNCKWGTILIWLTWSIKIENKKESRIKNISERYLPPLCFRRVNILCQAHRTLWSGFVGCLNTISDTTISMNHDFGYMKRPLYVEGITVMVIDEGFLHGRLNSFFFWNLVTCVIKMFDLEDSVVQLSSELFIALEVYSLVVLCIWSSISISEPRGKLLHCKFPVWCLTRRWLIYLSIQLAVTMGEEIYVW